MAEPTRRPLVAYLDMNVWIDMARGLHRSDVRWAEAVDSLRNAVADGRLLLPLSSSHYLELWHRSDSDSRTRVAEVMRDLSAYATLAPIQEIRQREIDVVVARHVGAPASTVTVLDLLGEGVNHAFGSPYGRFRFVESLASADGSVPEGRAVPATDVWEAMERRGLHWEWLNLVGIDEVLRSPGAERAPAHRLGTAYMQDELRLRELVEREAWARQRLQDLVVTEEITPLIDPINQSCKEAGVDPHGLFLENPAYKDPPAAMREFVRKLPSVDTVARLRLKKHSDLSHPWEQHDRVDIISLATAVPYCDTVLTERRWVHLIMASGLAVDYNVTLGHGIAAVESLLVDVDGGGRDEESQD